MSQDWSGLLFTSHVKDLFSVLFAASLFHMPSFGMMKRHQSLENARVRGKDPNKPTVVAIGMWTLASGRQEVHPLGEPASGKREEPQHSNLELPLITALHCLSQLGLCPLLENQSHI